MTYDISTEASKSFASAAIDALEITESHEMNERMILRAYAMVAEAERMIAAQRERIRTLENLSFTDELTGLTNRRGFNMALKREVAAAQRDASSNGTVIMIDLDDFKKINDQYGHDIGDLYLKAIADVLTRVLRGGDCIARLGGDEFAVLLPRTRSSQGQRRAAQLQAQINATSIQIGQGHALPLKISLGAANYAAGDSIENVMKRADARLYSNKAARKSKRIAAQDVV